MTEKTQTPTSHVTAPKDFDVVTALTNLLNTGWTVTLSYACTPKALVHLTSPEAARVFTGTTHVEALVDAWEAVNPSDPSWTDQDDDDQDGLPDEPTTLPRLDTHNPIGSLGEYGQREGEEPNYELRRVGGAAHIPLFNVTCTFMGLTVTSPTKNAKQAAKRKAATMMIELVLKEAENGR